MEVKVVPLSAIRRSEHAAVFRGGEHGAQVSFLVTTYRRDEGPEPHRHPYEETFIVLEGASVFTVEGETSEVGSGSVVVVPAGALHSFKAASDGITLQVNIHPSPDLITQFVE